MRFRGLLGFTEKQEFKLLTRHMQEILGAQRVEYHKKTEDSILTSEIYLEDKDSIKKLIVKLIKRDASNQEVKILETDSNGNLTELGEYSLDSEGLQELFETLGSKAKSSKDAQLNQSLLSVDVLLHEFSFYEQETGLDLVETSTQEVIQHNVSRISRYQTNKHVVFDIACSEHMVLIIIDKTTSAVQEIKHIGMGEKHKIKQFKQFIEKDGVSFFDYTKTMRVIFQEDRA